MLKSLSRAAIDRIIALCDSMPKEPETLNIPSPEAEALVEEILSDSNKQHSDLARQEQDYRDDEEAINYITGKTRRLSL